MRQCIVVFWQHTSSAYVRLALALVRASQAPLAVASSSSAAHPVGTIVGTAVGPEVVGVAVGLVVGSAVGMAVGVAVGVAVG